MKYSDLLKKRLKEELKLRIEDSDILVSRNPGRWQKEQGAFSWYVPGKNIGSQFTMKELVNAKELEIFYNPNGHKEIEIKKE